MTFEQRRASGNRGRPLTAGSQMGPSPSRSSSHLDEVVAAGLALCCFSRHVLPQLEATHSHFIQQCVVHDIC